MSFSLSVVAPFLNEEANLRSFLSRTHETLEKLAVDYEIVLVDDGSTDSSMEVVLDFMSSVPGHRVILSANEANQGIYKSWLNGLQASSKQLAVLIDTDLQNPPEAIASLYAAFMNNMCHAVQGTRSSIEFGVKVRLFASRVLNLILNFVFGSKARDHKSGFILAPRNLLSTMLPVQSRLRFGQTFVRAILEARGLLLHEVSTVFFPRPAGKSFLAGKEFQSAVKVLPEIFRVKLELMQVGRLHHLSPVEEAKSTDGYPRTSRTVRSTIWRTLFFLTLPLHTWNISRRTKRYLEILESSDWFTADSIKLVQTRRLSSLLWHCFGKVPHYRKYFIENVFLPDENLSADVLNRFPLLSKAEVSAALYFDLFAVDANQSRLHKIATSGSTGNPFVTYADRSQLDVRFATTLRAQLSTGWNFGKRQMRFWHQNIGMTRGKQVKERLNALVSRRTFIPAFELNQEKIEAMVAKIERRKPFLIDGYAESFNYLAQVLASKNLRHKPGAVMTSAQILTSQTRERIESLLGAKIFDKYGSREFSGIAYECEVGGGHHLQWESYIVELIVGGRPALPGETGEIVVTDLNNYAVPLIRYRVGDLAEALPEQVCVCGRSSPRIGKIVGRTQALVLASNGVWLPGSFFSHFFKEFESIISHFQIQQLQVGSFVLNAVKGPHWNQRSWENMMGEFGKYTGAECEVVVNFVGAIPLGRTGKRTPVVSELAIDFQRMQS